MIKFFEEIRKEDVPSVGGKGANLGEMTAAGITVPPGFVVTADAYRLFLEENSLTELFKTTLEQAGSNQEKLREAASMFRAKILAGKLPAQVIDAITKGYEKLDTQCTTHKPLRLAIRSSATAEDLPENSFAGQQETYLNVIGLPEVLKQVISCYASLWGNRAVFYRQANGYDQLDVALAVVIQVMVNSATSGVLFTVNPVSQNPNELQINASYGLGESVVSGRVTPDSYLCDKTGRLLNETIGEKATEIIYAENGTKELAVSPERQKARALNEAEIKALCTQAILIEKHYGCPMDIEWAICDGNVSILQARAITTLNKHTENTEEEQLIAGYLKGCKTSGMLKKNLAFLLEKMPDLFYPFDSDLTALINNQKSEIFAKAGILMSMQPQMDDDGIETLPSNDKKITKNIFKLGSILREIKDYPHCQQTLDKEMKAFTKELEALQKLPIENMTLADCGIALEKLYDYVRRLAYSRFYYALFPGTLLSKSCEKRAKKAGVTCTGYDFLQNLNNRSAESARDMVELAQKLRALPEASAAITEGAGYTSICERFPEVAILFKKYLSKYGYTSDFNCYCIYAQNLIEDPERLLHILCPLLTANDKENSSLHTTTYDELMNSLKSKMHPSNYQKLEQDVQYLRYFHIQREQSQYMWETAFYIMRQALSRAAFLATGNADYFDSLAYLFFPEVLNLCKRGSLNATEQEKINRRKQKRPLAEKIWERSKLLVFSENGDVLKGVSGSNGEAVGKVCIISGPKEFYKLKKGDILVCRLTDPEWTPLFTLAAAVVADTGAALSHAAIVAREYGIPAVLGVGYATMKFKDGDIIRVNGTRGEVSKLN